MISETRGDESDLTLKGWEPFLEYRKISKKRGGLPKLNSKGRACLLEHRVIFEKQEEEAGLVQGHLTISWT
jgi:hypothetical protein